MANTYQRGETVICWRNVKDESGSYVDPATSMKIKITDHQNGIEVDGVDMTKDDTGKYHYDFHTTVINLRGQYAVIYAATDGARITIKKDAFELE